MYNKRKQRGQTRKLYSLIQHTQDFLPFEDTSRGYDHFHVPCSQDFINSPKTSSRIKTEFIREWLTATKKIAQTKPAHLPFCKVVGLVCEYYLWDSQIIIFYDKDYYDSFWTRDNEYQRWTPCTSARSLLKERNIDSTLKEYCYDETIHEDDYSHHDKLWFYHE